MSEEQSEPNDNCGGSSSSTFLSRVLQTHVDIDATPQQVWEVLLDLPSWEDWNPFIPSAEGALEVGARLRIKVVLPGRKPMEFKPKVFTVRPCEEILWGRGFLGIIYHGDHAFLLKPLPRGKTRFRQRERFQGPLTLFMTNMIKETEADYHLMNQALKRRVEAKMSGSQAISPDP